MQSVLIAVIALWLSIGCGCFKGGERKQTPITNNNKAAADHSPIVPPDFWQPRPIGIRIFPTTRIVRQEGKAVLQATVELRDGMGDSVKSAGRFFFELYAPSNQETSPKRLFAWPVIEVMTLQQQKLYYEPIVRGYLFPLELHENWPNRRPAELRVLFTPPQGRRMHASAIVNPESTQTEAPVTPEPDQAPDEPR